MKKHTAIHLLGGNGARAARALGVDRSTVARWPTDAYGNITSRTIVNAVLAALARMRYLEAIGKGKAPDVDSDTLHDLMHEPEGMTE